jgi:hypothetical protein
MELATLDQQAAFIEGMLPRLAYLFEKDGVLVPTSLIFGRCAPDGTRLDAIRLMLTRQPSDKRLVRAFHLRLRDQLDAVGIASVNEGWRASLSCDGAFTDASVPASAHPDRQEIVIVVLSHRAGTHLWQANIIRDGKRPHLAPFTSARFSPHEIGGEMMNYFAPELEA